LIFNIASVVINSCAVAGIG